LLIFKAFWQTEKMISSQLITLFTGFFVQEEMNACLSGYLLQKKKPMQRVNALRMAASLSMLNHAIRIYLA